MTRTETLPRPVYLGRCRSQRLPLACSEPAQPQLEHDRMLRMSKMLDEMRSSAMARGHRRERGARAEPALRGFTKLDSLNLEAARRLRSKA